MLELREVTLSARINNVSGEFTHGESWHLLGANGSGKSSILKVLAGLEIPELGQVLYNKHHLNQIGLEELATIRCLVTQQYHCDFDLSVKECLQFFNTSHFVPELLESFLNLRPLLDKKLNALSGGEQQRVHIVRNLMQVWPAIELGKAILLFDEPTQQLDPKYQLKILNLLQQLKAKGNLLIISHHDVNQSLNHADKAMLLKRGGVFKSGKAKDILRADNLSALYNIEFHSISDKSLKHGYLLVN